MNKKIFIAMLAFAFVGMTNVMAGTSKDEKAEVSLVNGLDKTAYSGYQLVLTTQGGMGVIESVELVDSGSKTIRVTTSHYNTFVRIDHMVSGSGSAYSELFNTANSRTFEFQARTESFVIGANYNGDSSSSSTIQYETRYYDLVWRAY